MDTQGHMETAQGFLEAADRELAAGDVLQGSEKLWGAAAHVVMSVARERGWDHGKHGAMKAAVRRLADENGNRMLLAGFTAARALHANFYHDFMEDDDVEDARLLVRDFVERMTALRGASPNGDATP